jgi:uncharacterized protein
MKKELKQQDITVREAGRIGGNKVKDKYGPEFYEEIGHKGGVAKQKQLARKGNTNRSKKGGQRVKELIQDGKRAAAQEE